MLKIMRAEVLFLVTLLWFVTAVSASAFDCFQCHDSESFQGKVVHAPVADNECQVCHDPHVSREEKLLRQVEQELCFSCHESLAESLATQPVLHAPVRQGDCSACHSPHASDQPMLLKKKGWGLCGECHQESNKDFAFQHQPFADGDCSGCHAAHGGEDRRMLKQVGSKLCFSCHDNSRALSKKHLGYDLTQVECLQCHHPHGGKTANYLREVGHQPFADRECDSCHAGTKVNNTCLDCHEDQLNSFMFTYNHLGVTGSANACVTCHNPHAGDKPGLLPNNIGNVCRDCHFGTFDRQERNLHKHTDWDRCVDCHDLHGSNQIAMLKTGEDEDARMVCSLCHDQHKGFTHPIGEDAIDPRNGQAMDCLTCHNGNDGSNYRYFLRGSGERGLCVKCHQSY